MWANYRFSHGPEDGTDEGWIVGRRAVFKKHSDSTRILITYQDNLRVYGSGKACRWMVKLDGADCDTGTIATDMHVDNSNNDHSLHVLLGYCDGVKAGPHELRVQVMNSPGYSGSDCHTG